MTKNIYVKVHIENFKYNISKFLDWKELIVHLS